MIEKIINLIENGSLDEALKLLLNSIENDKKSPFFESIIMLKSNLNELETEKRNGVIQRADFEISKRGLVLSIIELAKKIDEKDDLKPYESNKLVLRSQEQRIIPSQENVNIRDVTNTGIITVNYKKRNLQIAGVLSLITIVIFILFYNDNFEIISQEESDSDLLSGIYSQNDANEDSFLSIISLEFLPNNYVFVTYKFLGADMPTEHRYEIAGDRVIVETTEGNIGFQRVGRDTLRCTQPLLGNIYLVRK